MLVRNFRRTFPRRRPASGSIGLLNYDALGSLGPRCLSPTIGGIMQRGELVGEPGDGETLAAAG